MAILVDDGLQILQNFSIGTKECFEARIDVALYFMHMFFVITQVAYIYRYSKVFIRSKLTHTAGPKIGLMFLIATNISCWFISVVDEAVHALHEESGDEHGESDTGHSDGSGHEEGSADHDSGSSCTCDTSFCNTANIAQEFLFPFVIEFSLVSSFLLYIVWKNVGKTTPPYENIIRPSYKIYNSYIGIGVGFLFVFSTIIIMIVLGNTSSDGFNQQSYALDAAFTTIAESLMIIGCSIGFYLFIRIPRPNEPPLMLDVVLLVICVLGPIIQDLFTLLAVIDGTENKIQGWGITVVAPLWDSNFK